MTNEFLGLEKKKSPKRNCPSWQFSESGSFRTLRATREPRVVTFPVACTRELTSARGGLGPLMMESVYWELLADPRPRGDMMMTREA